MHVRKSLKLKLLDDPTGVCLEYQILQDPVSQICVTRVLAVQAQKVEVLEETQDLSWDAAELALVEWAGFKMIEGYEESSGAPRDEPVADLDPQAVEESVKKRAATALVALDRAVAENNETEIRRLVWRLGEFAYQPALDKILPLLARGDALLEYCGAWALGRIGDAEATASLTQLYQASSSEATRRLALEGLLVCSQGKALTKLKDKLRKSIPESLQAALAAESADRLTEEIRAFAQVASPEWIKVLVALYHLSRFYPELQLALVRYLREAPLVANVFKALRIVFKLAEFRRDAECFGVLAHRFETTRSFYSHYAWEFDYVLLPDRQNYVFYSTEIGQDHCRLAYSAKTRDYLRLRAWRVIRKLASSDADSFVYFAFYALLPFSDADGTQQRVSKVRDWRPDDQGDWKQVVVASRQFGPFSGYFGLNQLLHRHSRRFRPVPSGRAWMDTGSSDEDYAGDLRALPRTEAFSRHWDRHPDLLLRLIQESRCSVVQRFATRALVDNQAYCTALDPELLKELLKSPYEITVVFVLEVLRQREDLGKSRRMQQALVQSVSPAARALGREFIERHADAHSQMLDRLFEGVVSPDSDMRAWVALQLATQEFDGVSKRELLNRILDYLIENASELVAVGDVVLDLNPLMQRHFKEQLGSMEMRYIERLLGHAVAPLQAVAVTLIMAQGAPAEFLPVKVYRALLESTTPSVRSTGLQMLEQLPERVLLNEPKMIAGLCTSPFAEVGQQVRAKIKTLVAKSEVFAVALACEFVRTLLSPRFVFRDSSEFLCFVEDTLGDSLYFLDAASVRGLLYSPRKELRDFGARLLAAGKSASYTCAEWAQFADHEFKRVRDWARSAYEQNVEEIRAHPHTAIKLLQSRWQDSREFGLKFFMTHFTAREWTSDVLIRLCESDYHDVQRLGFELVMDFFHEGQGVEYLIKLSQHPSPAAHKLVSGLLERYALDNPGRLKMLTPFFLSVLRQTRSRRVVRDRVLAFLFAQASAAEEVALWVIPLFEQQVQIGILKEKYQILEYLVCLMAQFPSVSSMQKFEQPAVSADRRVARA